MGLTVITLEIRNSVYFLHATVLWELTYGRSRLEKKIVDCMNVLLKFIHTPVQFLIILFQRLHFNTHFHFLGSQRQEVGKLTMVAEVETPMSSPSARVCD